MKIHLIGDVTYKRFKWFCRQLTRAEKHFMSGSEVHITLSSEGGSAYVALAYFDRIKASPLNINITVVGLCASAAVLILAAGKTRRMTRNAWAMVHDDQIFGVDGKRVVHAKKDIIHYERLETQWNKILAGVTKISEKEWAQLHAYETYLTPSECLEYGLVEEIIP